MFATLTQASVDWNIIAGAVATFIVTAIATALGFRKGFKKVRIERTQVTPIVGASLMDNLSVVMLTEALKENTELHRQIHSCLVQLVMLLQMGINKKD